VPISLPIGAFDYTFSNRNKKSKVKKKRWLSLEICIKNHPFFLSKKTKDIKCTVCGIRV
jgi:ribosomal protein L31